MRLFGNTRRECAAKTLLRHMENGRFTEALRVLRRRGEGPIPPPHALWRLGRWSLDKGRAKHALRPLQLFLASYPNHQDRPEVLRDLARALGTLGRAKEAEQAAREAQALGTSRDSRRKEQRQHDKILAGRARQPHTNHRI